MASSRFEAGERVSGKWEEVCCVFNLLWATTQVKEWHRRKHHHTLRGWPQHSSMTLELGATGAEDMAERGKAAESLRQMRRVKEGPRMRKGQREPERVHIVTAEAMVSNGTVGRGSGR